MNRLICDKCLKNRPISYFRKYAVIKKLQDGSYELICDYCSCNKYQKQPFLTTDTKICLKCDKDFRSVNGNRLCWSCKYENEEYISDFTPL